MKNRRRGRLLREYTPDFPAFVKWIWVGILVIPVLIALLLQFTG